MSGAGPGFGTPRRDHSDRFIPCRRKLDFESAHRLLKDTPAAAILSPDHPTHQNPSEELENSESPEERAYKQHLNVAFNHKPFQRVLSFSAYSSYDSPSHRSPCSDLFSPFNTSLSSPFGPVSPPQKKRLPFMRPERVLALPDLRDDFYCNPMDWGNNNILAVALGNTPFIWNATANEASILGKDDPRRMDEHLLPEASKYVSSVKWNYDSQRMAVGLNRGKLELWDVGKQESLTKEVNVGKKQIGCMEWEGDLLYCGSRDGYIRILDTRTEMKQPVASMKPKRRFEVTSLQLSPDSTMLASGSDDGFVRLWCKQSHTLLHEMDAHESSIKALSWCPWKHALLASGGGCKDGKIILWNRHGQAVFEQDTHTQTCSMVWSQEYSELVTSHGHPGNEIMVWSVRDMEIRRQGILDRHCKRTLHMALSPDRTMVASAGADELLCIWKLFPRKKSKEKQHSPVDLFGLR